MKRPGEQAKFIAMGHRVVSTKRDFPTGRRASTAENSLRPLLTYFLRLGTLGFGGPIALAGHMQRELVEERHWITKEDYVEGLAFSQLSPGPLAALYLHFGELPWIQSAFYGIGAAVGAITGATFVLGRRALVDSLTSLIAITTLAILLATKKVPEPLLILAAGGVGLLLHRGAY